MASRWELGGQQLLEKSVMADDSPGASASLLCGSSMGGYGLRFGLGEPKDGANFILSMPQWWSFFGERKKKVVSGSTETLSLKIVVTSCF